MYCKSKNQFVFVFMLHLEEGLSEMDNRKEKKEK